MGRRDGRGTGVLGRDVLRDKACAPHGHSDVGFDDARPARGPFSACRGSAAAPRSVVVALGGPRRAERRRILRARLCRCPAVTHLDCRVDHGARPARARRARLAPWCGAFPDGCSPARSELHQQMWPPWCRQGRASISGSAHPCRAGAITSGGTDQTMEGDGTRCRVPPGNFSSVAWHSSSSHSPSKDRPRRWTAPRSPVSPSSPSSRPRSHSGAGSSGSRGSPPARWEQLDSSTR